MRKLFLTLGLVSLFLTGSVFADHKADLLAFSEELAEEAEHFSENLLVTPGYVRSVKAAEEMGEAAHHFNEAVLSSSNLSHVYDDYREFYSAYKLTRSAFRSEYRGDIDIHLMRDWLNISHVFRTVRKIMRYYSN